MMNTGQTEGGGLAARGITIMEIMVVICIAAIVLAVSVSVLGSVAARRGAAATLARLDQTAKIIALYANDHRERVPTIFAVGEGPWSVRLASGWEDSFPRYFLSGMLWHLAATDGYLDGTPWPEAVFAAPRNGRGRLSGMPFHIPCTYFAKPEFWNPSTRVLTNEQLGPAAMSQILFPSAKSLIVSLAHTTMRIRPEKDPPYRALDPLPGKVPLAAADGSAHTLMPADLLPGMQSGEGRHQHAMHTFDYSFGLHTLGGVRGRDLP